MVRHIMIAIDGSESATRALDFAADLAKLAGGKLSILNVAGNLTGDEMRRLAAAEKDVGAALDAMAAQILREARLRAAKAGAPDVSTEVMWGDAAEALIEAARSKNADTIVVGRRGRSRLAGLLLGSVSQKVASLAPCTVIIVP
jgi:nucleotide-binding universal stress UspA family protein